MNESELKFRSRSVPNFSDSFCNPFVPERTNWNEIQPWIKVEFEGTQNECAYKLNNIELQKFSFN